MKASKELVDELLIDSTSADKAETRYRAIRAWWLSSGATTEQGLSRLELWLAFWHFRYRQWGGFIQLVHLLFFISSHMTLSTLREFMVLHSSILFSSMSRPSVESHQIGACQDALM
jgi:hypothetical protein